MNAQSLRSYSIILLCIVITFTIVQNKSDAQNQINSSTIKFMILGDFGTGGKGQKAVANAMAEKKKIEGADFVLGVGDNFYPSGVSSTTDEQWKNKFENMYDASQLNIPFYQTFGNHDYLQNIDAQVEYSNKSTRWKMPDRYYSISRTLPSSQSSDKIEVSFFGIDTPALIGNANDSRLELRWLDSALAVCSSRWKFVYGHHPVFSNGYHGNMPRLIKILKPILDKHHVDVYFAGHDHDLQMLKPVNGVNYVISGGGSSPRNIFPKENTIFAKGVLGFAWCSLTANELQLQFVDSKSNVLYATTLKK